MTKHKPPGLIRRLLMLLLLLAGLGVATAPEKAGASYGCGVCPIPYHCNWITGDCECDCPDLAGNCPASCA